MLNKLERTLRGIVKYCKDNIYDYENRLGYALKKIDHIREPLFLVCPDLYDEIEEAIIDYCEEYGYNSEDISVEDIIFYN